MKRSVNLRVSVLYLATTINGNMIVVKCVLTLRLYSFGDVKKQPT